VAYVYNPLEYARAPYEAYLKRYGQGPREIIFLGMNPGPWGMAQTGVPFGEVNAVRDWLKINEPVKKPEKTHPKRPVQGFGCNRSEVSGKRVWGWAQNRFQRPNRFFKRFWVANYCPLMFMETSGRNRTPDQLRVAERKPVLEICDLGLRDLVKEKDPSWVIGVGKFAQSRAQAALSDMGVKIGAILHPSPANPAANRGWHTAMEAQLRGLGISL
jgi:single-strand selective monofunctional uracil DNA glycosylase